MTKLFVGGLPYAVDNNALADMFKEFGEVSSAQVITDRETGQSKGFGFVEMTEDSAAQAAISQLDGSELNNRRLGVSVARPKENSDRPSGGFRSRDNNRNSGGYSGNSNGGGFGGNRNSNGGNGGFSGNRNNNSGGDRGGFAGNRNSNGGGFGGNRRPGGGNGRSNNNGNRNNSFGNRNKW